MNVRIGVSFDLLGTLIVVRRSPGYQYCTYFRSYLERKGLQLPTVDEPKLNASFKRSIKSEMEKCRKLWVEKGLGEPKEAPLSGVEPGEVFAFWCSVVDGTLGNDSDYYFDDKEIKSVIQEARKNGEWKDFIEDVVERFSTPEPYEWLPKTVNTLRALQQWRQQQLSHGVLCAIPTVVSNSDSRLAHAISAMLQQEEAGERLVGGLFFADTVGVAKPSPRGIMLACESCGVTSVKYWVHVGDDEEDREAAERAGCHFIRCSSTEGPDWGGLQAKLQELCHHALRAN
uniref:WGS project CAEQ00000000 data, annotated contig 308 n=1 Tax=Trypanosoma congolense (strain IL3000) TaxID=1068625 RepID=F9WER9_TRYCI|nr:unnamed protein product [Trypanosoma congolense IL3000]